MGAEEEDLETHYNLGMPSRMAFLEEAISEFQKVAKASDRAVLPLHQAVLHVARAGVMEFADGSRGGPFAEGDARCNAFEIFSSRPFRQVRAKLVEDFLQATGLARRRSGRRRRRGFAAAGG